MQPLWRLMLVLVMFVGAAALIAACADMPTGGDERSVVKLPETTGPKFGFWACPSGEVNTTTCQSGEPEWCSDATSMSGAYCSTGTTCFELAVLGNLDQCTAYLTIDPCTAYPELCDWGGGGPVLGPIDATIDDYSSTASGTRDSAEIALDEELNAISGPWVCPPATAALFDNENTVQNPGAPYSFSMKNIYYSYGGVPVNAGVGGATVTPPFTLKVMDGDGWWKGNEYVSGWYLPSEALLIPANPVPVTFRFVPSMSKGVRYICRYKYNASTGRFTGKFEHTGNIHMYFVQVF